MPEPTPVLLLAGLDATDTEVVAMGLQCDLPGAAVVRLWIDGAAGRVGWKVSDLTGIVEDASQPVEHACLSCSMREALLPALVRLAESGRWQTLVVVLPVGAEPLPMALGIARGDVGGSPAAAALDLRSVTTVVSCEDLCAGVFDDPLLEEVGLAMIAGDRRAYGEALVAQIEYADAIVTTAAGFDAPDSALLDHLRRPDSTRHHGLSSLSADDAAALLARRHDPDRAATSVDPRFRAPTGAEGAGGIVTLDLASWKAFHPARLLERIEDLGAGDLRGRGAFWLPGRPELAIAWDGAGAQLSIGAVGGWDDAPRQTRLVITTDTDAAPGIAQAFADCLMTDAEMVTARQRWMGRPDGFEAWLGDEQSDVA